MTHSLPCAFRSFLLIIIADTGVYFNMRKQTSSPIPCRSGMWLVRVGRFLSTIYGTLAGHTPIRGTQPPPRFRSSPNPWQRRDQYYGLSDPEPLVKQSSAKLACTRQQHISCINLNVFINPILDCESCIGSCGRCSSLLVSASFWRRLLCEWWWID